MHNSFSKPSKPTNWVWKYCKTPTPPMTSPPACLHCITFAPQSFHCAHFYKQWCATWPMEGFSLCAFQMGKRWWSIYTGTRCFMMVCSPFVNTGRGSQSVLDRGLQFPLKTLSCKVGGRVAGGGGLWGVCGGKPCGESMGGGTRWKGGCHVERMYVYRRIHTHIHTISSPHISTFLLHRTRGWVNRGQL